MQIRAFFEMLWTRRWVAVSAIAIALLASPLWLRALHPTYVASAEIALVGSTTTPVLPPSDVPDLATSSDVFERVQADLGSRYSLEAIIAATSVRSDQHSNVLPVTAKSKDPRMAVEVANAVADETVKEYKNLAGREYDSVITSLESQLRGEQATIAGIDSRLKSAVEADPAVGSQEGLESISKQLSQLEADRATANATYLADSEGAKTLNEPETQLTSVYAEQALASDPGFSALRTVQSKDAAQLESVQAGYKDAFPGLPGLKEQVARESRAVHRLGEKTVAEHVAESSTYAAAMVAGHAAKATASGDLARVRAIDAEINRTQSQLRRLPISGDQLRLRRDSAANAMQQVEARLEQTLADKAQAGSLNSLVILNRATDASPKISAMVMSIIIVGLIAAFAIGAAFLAELIDPRIRSASDVENVYGAPLAG